MCVCTYVCVYTYRERRRDRAREGERGRERANSKLGPTLGSHPRCVAVLPFTTGLCMASRSAKQGRLSSSVPCLFWVSVNLAIFWLSFRTLTVSVSTVF